MPIIPTYNTPEPDIRVPDTASEAWSRAAMHIGEMGRQGAQATAQGFNAAAKGVEEFGAKVNQQQEATEHLNGIVSLTQLQANDQTQLQSILNSSDPSSIPNQLTQFHQDQQSRLQDWAGQFQTPQMKDWAAEKIGEYSLDQTHRYYADLSNATANNIHNSLTSTIGNIANSLGQNPTMQDVSRAMSNYDEMTAAALKDTNLTQQARADIQKGFEADKSRIAELAYTRNPSLAQPILDTYSGMLTPEQQVKLQGHVNTDVGRSAADNMIASWTGGTPITQHYAPGSTDGMTNATRAAAVLRNEFHWNDGAIQGALNNGFGESGFREWNNPGSAGEMGVWQFNPSSHLPLFQQQYPGDTSVEAQTRYMAQYVNSHMPGYGMTSDPDVATARFMTGFERPADQSTQAIQARIDNSAKSQWALHGLNNQQQPQLPSPVPAANSSNTIAVGDSIGWGLIKHGGLGGEASPGPAAHQTFTQTATTASGNNPSEILAQIKALPDQTFQGQNIVLSTGASNAHGDTSVVQQQIDALKTKGVASITILGVGTRPDVAAANTDLQKLAQQNGLAFAPLGKTGDGIHPSDYQALARSLPAPQKPPTSPAGQAAPTPPTDQSGQSTQPGQPTPTGAGEGGASPTQSTASNYGAPFPSLEDSIKGLPPTLTPEQRDIAVEHLSRAHDQLTKMSAEERANLVQDLQGGLERLTNGQPYTFDENQIRHYLEPKAADKIIGQLHEAQQVGAQIGQIRTIPTAEVVTTMANLQNSLRDTNASDYQERKLLVDAYTRAADTHLKELGVLPSEKPADPVSYIVRTNPDINKAYMAQDRSNPDSMQAYANTMLSWQDHLGLRSDQQHVLSTPEALAQTQTIIQNPATAQAQLNELQREYGPDFQHVWYDLTTLGKLPAQYQMLGALEPADAAMLSRALTEQTTARLGDKGAEGYWDNTLPRTAGVTSPYNAVRQAIREDPKVQQFELSMRNSNASGAQINGLVGAIDTLAFARMQYAGDNASTAADNAISAALGHYDFSLGARVPVNVASTVIGNANHVLNSLTVNDLTMPKSIGGHGQPTAEQYLSYIKNSPTWYTTPKEDAVQLVDPGGRLVRDKSGAPITIHFSDAPIPGAQPSPPPQESPLPSPFPPGGQ